jgi:hypothetical protein
LTACPSDFPEAQAYLRRMTFGELALISENLPGSANEKPLRLGLDNASTLRGQALSCNDFHVAQNLVISGYLLCSLKAHVSLAFIA